MVFRDNSDDRRINVNLNENLELRNNAIEEENLVVFFEKNSGIFFFLFLQLKKENVEDNKKINQNYLPENLLQKKLIDKISKHLSQIALNEDILETAEKIRKEQSEKKKILPFSFTFQDNLENKEEKEEGNAEENENNLGNEYEFPYEDNNNNANLDFLQTEKNEKLNESAISREILTNKIINKKESAINQKVALVY